MDQIFARDRLRLLLDHFAAVGDPRQACKVQSPLREVLFLATCASIAGCDDYDEIAAWGAHHHLFLKGYGEYFFGTPKEDWLRVVLNRIDPALFEACFTTWALFHDLGPCFTTWGPVSRPGPCFTTWALSLRPDAPDLIALDGKTARRSGDEAASLKPIRLVSAWASTQRLVLAQEAVDAKDNECAAILSILDRLTIKGALVTIDAIATNPAVAKAITDKGGDYILALQPTLHSEVDAYFSDPATTGLATLQPSTRIMAASKPAPPRSARTWAGSPATAATQKNLALSP